MDDLIFNIFSHHFRNAVVLCLPFHNKKSLGAWLRLD